MPQTSTQDITHLIDQAKAALASGDRRQAGLLIHQALDQDFENPELWPLLYTLVNGQGTLGEFKRTFTQRYYPDRVVPQPQSAAPVPTPTPIVTRPDPVLPSPEITSAADLLRLAQERYSAGDTGTAGRLLDEILKRDFLNTEAWALLHKLYGRGESFEDFRLAFVEKYYPKNAVLFRAMRSVAQFNQSVNQAASATAASTPSASVSTGIKQSAQDAKSTQPQPVRFTKRLLYSSLISASFVGAIAVLLLLFPGVEGASEYSGGIVFGLILMFVILAAVPYLVPLIILAAIILAAKSMAGGAAVGTVFGLVAEVVLVATNSSLKSQRIGKIALAFGAIVAWAVLIDKVVIVQFLPLAGWKITLSHIAGAITGLIVFAIMAGNMIEETAEENGENSIGKAAKAPWRFFGRLARGAMGQYETAQDSRNQK